MASSYATLALSSLLLMSCVSWGSATSYTVGDSQGWTLGVNYSTWATGKKFVVSDQLVFINQNGQHTVTEVSSSDYNACSASKPIRNSSAAITILTLDTAGSHYFICTVPGHCSAGMKLAVNVAASAPTTPAPSTLTILAPSNSASRAAAGLVPIASAVAATAALVATLF